MKTQPSFLPLFFVLFFSLGSAAALAEEPLEDEHSPKEETSPAPSAFAEEAPQQRTPMSVALEQQDNRLSGLSPEQTFELAKELAAQIQNKGDRQFAENAAYLAARKLEDLQQKQEEAIKKLEKTLEKLPENKMGSKKGSRLNRQLELAKAVEKTTRLQLRELNTGFNSQIAPPAPRAPKTPSN